MTRKVHNIRSNPDKIYFSIDDENYPYKGVKGRGDARISEDIQKNLSIIERINLKYLGSLEHPLAKRLMENTRNGSQVVIKYLSFPDFKSVTKRVFQPKKPILLRRRKIRLATTVCKVERVQFE